MKLDLGWGDDAPAQRPRPLPKPRPRKKPRTALLLAAVAVLALTMGLGARMGRASLTDDVTALQQRVDALEVTTAAATDEAAFWRSEAASATTAFEAVESDLASMTVSLDFWHRRATEASETIGILEAEKSKLIQQLSSQRSTDTSALKTASTGAWQTARVSWYGPNFYGNTMAGGGTLTPDSMVVAHRSMDFGTKIEFRYNGRTCVAVVQDRGPFIAGRVFDLGPGTAKALGFSGVGNVEWRVV